MRRLDYVVFLWLFMVGCGINFFAALVFATAAQQSGEWLYVGGACLAVFNLLGHGVAMYYVLLQSVWQAPMTAEQSTILPPPTSAIPVPLTSGAEARLSGDELKRFKEQAAEIGREALKRRQ